MGSSCLHPFVCSYPVTVGANHFTQCNLTLGLFDAFRRAHIDGFAFFHMVKVKCCMVLFVSAIGTPMLNLEGPQKLKNSLPASVALLSQPLSVSRPFASVFVPFASVFRRVAGTRALVSCGVRALARTVSSVFVRTRHIRIAMLASHGIISYMGCRKQHTMHAAVSQAPARKFL